MEMFEYNDLVALKRKYFKLKFLMSAKFKNLLGNAQILFYLILLFKMTKQRNYRKCKSSCYNLTQPFKN